MEKGREKTLVRTWQSQSLFFLIGCIHIPHNGNAVDDHDMANDNGDDVDGNNDDNGSDDTSDDVPTMVQNSLILKQAKQSEWSKRLC